MTKLFIGGLPDNIQEMDLAIHVSIYGQIDTIKVVRDRATGRCKGFAFLEVIDLAAANNIIDNLNGETFKGNTLTVKISEELPQQKPAYKKAGDPYKKKRARL
ncbi:RNA recognition motif domain-containing protein [Pedobacter punctiformis]|uniref:RNA-binding protein n=1 Tax=Pedobacter punctiformis TaxID=3004097 RepID=A0ABT4L5T5_9SPHI|nr:RNA-binding protein [Pedobacter sp. HCMS5-2]MCZ4243282.1 RNA-binding protein [Pedobacter sp. HCMS5-2]